MENTVFSLRDLRVVRPGAGAFRLHVRSLYVRQGQLLALTGPSGCGKSTALDVLAGILRPDSGDGSRFLLRTADGETDMLALWRAGRLDALARLRGKHLGYVLQTGGLLPFLSARDNILLPCRCLGIMGRRLEAVWNMATALGIDRLLLQMPDSLSVGERQRVAIARALATNPQVLLCDEATSALDPATTDSILTLIRDINRDLGITAVIITHEMSVIEKICSHVAIINRGKIVEHGEVEDVFFHPRTEAARRLVMPEALQNLPQENLYRLIFNGRSSFEPVIANMVLECHCPVNIMYADTRDIGGIAFGQMVLQLPECPESRRSILEFAKSRNILLEEMKHV